MQIRIVGSINGKDEANLIKGVSELFIIESRIKSLMEEE